MRTLSFALVAALAAGCTAPKPKARPPRGLEQAFFFVEEPRHEDDIAVSGSKGTTGPVTKVIEDAEVDNDSKIGVFVDRARLTSAAADPELTREIDALQAREKALEGLLELYGRWLDARTETVKAYGETLNLTPEQRADPANATVNRFIELRDAADGLKLTLLDGVIEQYVNDDAKFAQLDKIGLNTSLLGLDGFLSAEIEELKEAIDELARSREATLRLEAFLLSPERDPRAIHLEHYDRLEQMSLQYDEGSALDISAAELARMIEITRSMAAAAERVRRKEATLAEAFRGISPKLARRLDAIDAELRALGERLDEESVEELAAKTRAGISAFFELAKQGLEAALAERVGAARESFGTELAGELGQATALLARWDSLTRRVEDVRERLREFDVETALSLLPEVVAAADEATEIARGLKALFDASPDMLARIRARLDEQLAGLPEDVKARLLAAWDASEVQQPLAEWRDLHRRAVRILDEIRLLLGLGGILPLPAGTRVPEAFDVPLADVDDTRIELARTDRKPGDRVVLRATLTPQGEEPEQSEATFRVARFGWHDSIEPSLVLAQAETLRRVPNEFQFAPALTWAWTYYPRAEAEGWWTGAARFAKPSIGLHAILLDFDPNNSTEIGLGATVALWQSRLQFGYGYNPMADTEDDGRFYYFIGSSLIPLLQSLSNRIGD